MEPVGNHFQAVHYKTDDYESYARNIVDLAATLNKILAKHGWKELDAIGYDVGKTTKAANEALAALRKHAKARKGVAQQVTTSTAVRTEPRTIAMEVSELQALEKRQRHDMVRQLREIAAAADQQTEARSTNDSGERRSEDGRVPTTESGQLTADSLVGTTARREEGAREPERYSEREGTNTTA
jgi:hypothetical protein